MRNPGHMGPRWRGIEAELTDDSQQLCERAVLEGDPPAPSGTLSRDAIYRSNESSPLTPDQLQSCKQNKLFLFAF